MADASRWRGRRTTLVGAGVLLTLVAGSLTAPARAETAPAAEQAVDCPTAVPRDSIKAGLKGEGLTVVTGSTPQPFAVDVLGVLKDGIGPGRDMVIIKVSDLPGGHVVDQGGGIWAGMSGSPVYVNRRLLGAVSYGFTLAPSPIGGLTPAADMLDLLDLPKSVAVRSEPVVRKTSKATLSTSSRREFAAQARVTAPRGTLQQLVSPLAVSGLGSKRINRLQDDADAAGWTVKAYAAGGRAATRATASALARPQAGGNFAAALSYGDVTMAAIGTTTAVCGNRALAFGHPFRRSGPATLGANDADSLTIVQDDTLGSFKLANVGPGFGTVDQDRTAGLRAKLGAAPATADLTTIIRNRDNGKKRTGTTQVVDQAVLAEALLFSIWGNDDAAFDEWGDGTATSAWTITGRRAGGLPFSVSRSNQWADRYDVTGSPAFDAAAAADALINNDFEKVVVDDVVFSSTASTKFEQRHLTKLEVAVNGGRYSAPRLLVVKPGAKLSVRVSMRPYRSTVTSTTTLALTVPKNARGKVGSLTAAGGMTLAEQGGQAPDPGCLLTGGGCGDQTEGSLDAVIKGITSTPRNDAVVARLSLDSQDGGSTSAVSASRLQPLTVTGQRSMEVEVR